MNVVGKVGSFITAGVYSVATPFHPFGGAVDIIAVQQQDGSFRSTPWYVRFGKFQGVLKGAEKVVRIEVNGKEANFHMYLDNSGEAYFIKDVSEEGVSNEGSRAEQSVQEEDSNYGDNDQYTKTDILAMRDNDNSQIKDERIALGMDRLERTKSDSERRFYDFPDDQSSLEGSVDLSDYGSGRYENLEQTEHVIETQDSSSEVILVSVDGHILTAPISSSERNDEDVELDTPQFHLGPGEGPEFCESGSEFNAGEAGWAADYLTKLDLSTGGIADRDVCISATDVDSSGMEVEVCEGDGDHPHQVQTTHELTIEERDNIDTGTLETTSASMRKDDVFKSCLELPELAIQDDNSNRTDKDSSLEVYEVDQELQDKSAGKLFLSSSDPQISIPLPTSEVKVESLDKHVADAKHENSNGASAHFADNVHVPEKKIDVELTASGMEATQEEVASLGKLDKIEEMEPQTASSLDSKEVVPRLEISLCRNLLHAGMGSFAAAEVFDSNLVSEDEFRRSSESIIRNENLVVRIQGRYLPWDKAAPLVLGMAAYGLNLPVQENDLILVEQGETPKTGEDGPGSASTPSSRRWRLWPIPFRRVKTLEHTSSSSSNEDVFVDSESFHNQTGEATPKANMSKESPHKQLIRTNVPTSDQIASLNLKEGQNIVHFFFCTRVLGLQKVEAHIYLWKWNARIVISDVDGTITKSDVLGQVMPLVGKDWTHSGIARLFCAIKENGYQLLFLSARAIVQAYLTKNFLFNLKQDGKNLPNGPVVISPDGLFPSLFREVIRRAPHEFKIACLEDIKALFPPDYNPFYAGFGNRDTDELSYRKIGIPKGKIFIINPKGEVAINHRIDVKSYTSLHTLVNDMFPPTSLVEQLQEDYNSWNFWRMPLPDVDSL